MREAAYSTSDFKSSSTHERRTWLEQGLAHARTVELARPVVEAQPGVGEQCAPREREAVGMDAARRDADDRVPGLAGGPRHEGVEGDGAEARSDDVEPAGGRVPADDLRKHCELPARDLDAGVRAPFFRPTPIWRASRDRGLDREVVEERPGVAPTQITSLSYRDAVDAIVSKRPVCSATITLDPAESVPTAIPGGATSRTARSARSRDGARRLPVSIAPRTREGATPRSPRPCHARGGVGVAHSRTAADLADAPPSPAPDASTQPTQSTHPTQPNACEAGDVADAPAIPRSR